MFNAALVCAFAVLGLHAARAGLDPDMQLETLRLAAFVPARLWTLAAPDWTLGRLAAAPRDAAQIAAFWLGEGAAPWSALSYALVHAGCAHAISNAVLLGVLGAPVAARMSAGRFVALLALGAVAGAAAQMSATDALFAPLVGASACVCAAIGALARLLTAQGGEAGVGFVASLRRPQTMAAFAAGLVAIFATALIGDDMAAIGWRAHLGGFLAGFVASGVLAGGRKTQRRQTCRLARTEASFESD